MLIRSKSKGGSHGKKRDAEICSLEIAGAGANPTFTFGNDDFEFVALGTREFVSEVSDAVRKNTKLISDDFASVAFESQGILIICDRKSGKIYLQTDLLGLFSVFWAIADNEIIISDSLYQLYSARGGEIDEVGVMEYLLFGYSIGQRTFYRNIMRLRPGESLRFEPASGEIKLRDLSDLWKGHLSSGRKKIIDLGCELLTEACRPMADSLLMFSAGWDSRALLAGAFAAGVGDTVKTYHHGDLKSREAQLVKKMVTQCNLPLLSHQIEASDFENDFLSKIFERYNSVLFPHWYVASQISNASENNIESVSAGVFGEIIGGHYGPPMVLSGWRKMASTLGYLFKKPSSPKRERGNGRDNPADAAAYLYQSEYVTPWYMQDSVWNDRFKSMHGKVNGDIEQSINRYISRGIETKEAIIEAFITEHRGTQYIAAQLHSAATYKPVLAPFCYRGLIDYSSKVPYEFKVTNTLTQAIIKRLYPKLLEVPTAAVLCKAKHSIFIQETSRALRKVSEKGAGIASRLRREKTRRMRLGWLNYEFLEREPVIENLIGSLESPLWDKDKMRSFFNQNRHISVHDFMDMFLKIKTLDLFKVK